MLVTSQLPIQTTKVLYIFLTCTCAPHFEKGSATHVSHHKYFLQYSTFASEKLQVRTWGRQTRFLTWAPSHLVTPLQPYSD